MLAKANRRLFILRKYTCKFSRKTLRQLYLSYIRPTLEYGSQVWTYLTLNESESIEEVQRAAMRIITGLKSGTSHEALNNEMDLPSMSYRRYVTRMVNFFDILHSENPERLGRHSVNTVSERNPYNTRRSLDVSLPLPRSEHRRRSYLFTAIKEWNSLPVSIRSITTRNGLRTSLKYKSKPNPYYSYELTRMSNVNLTRLRSGNHNLNDNLHRISLIDSPACDCGHPCEDDIHYFMECPRYNQARKDITCVIPLEAWNINTIYRGSPRYDIKLNETICITVQRFITSTARFK